MSRLGREVFIASARPVQPQKARPRWGLALDPSPSTVSAVKSCVGLTKGEVDTAMAELGASATAEERDLLRQVEDG